MIVAHENLEGYRRDLAVALERYRTLWPREQAVVDRFVALIDSSYPNCLQRSHESPGHITASAWVTDPKGEFVLLAHHRKLGRWLQLGGHADGDPDLPAVAVRESREESGIGEIEPTFVDRWTIFDLDVHTIPAFGKTPRHNHFDVRFALAAADRREPTASSESHAVCWVHVSKLHDYTHEESVARMGRKWCAYRDGERAGPAFS